AEHAALSVAQQIRRELGRDDRHVAAARIAKSRALRMANGGAPCLRDARAVEEPDPARLNHHHRQRVTLTCVPLSPADSIDNSFCSRSSPDSPRPGPLPAL